MEQTVTESETPFADQVERDLKALRECWDKLRNNPRIRATAERIRKAKEEEEGT